MSFLIVRTWSKALQKSPSLWRLSSTGSGRGRTLPKALNDYNLLEADQELVRIDRVKEDGFVVNNVYVDGAVLAHGSTWMMWAVKDVEGVTPQSLAFVNLIKPVPDLLILGTGPRPAMPPRETLAMLRGLGMGLEMLPTVRATQYFNLLNQEQRNVVCALLPGE